VVAVFSYARALVAVVLLAIVSACGGGGAEESESSPAPGADGTPSIGGTPPATVRIGEPYTFRPTVANLGGADLKFTAAHLPPWAQLDPHTGKLTGTPRSGDEGVYSGITIRVSAGAVSAVLPAFSLQVNQDASGIATLSWDAPTQHSDGTPLVDLAGYRIEYGRVADDPDQFLLIGNPSINTVVIERLSSGTWHFAVVALDDQSIESEPSVLASQTIS
jgi:hypothetical protein